MFIKTLLLMTGGIGMIDVLKKLNQHLELESVHNDSFLPYGRVLYDFPYDEMAKRMDKTVIPEEGNQYVPSFKELEDEALKNSLKNAIMVVCLFKLVTVMEIILRSAVLSFTKGVK